MSWGDIVWKKCEHGRTIAAGCIQCLEEENERLRNQGEDCQCMTARGTWPISIAGKCSECKRPRAAGTPGGD